MAEPRRMKLNVVLMMHLFLGDKSVIMCGVAQEDVSENQEEFGPTKTAYTRPWHVNVITVSLI